MPRFYIPPILLLCLALAIPVSATELTPAEQRLKEMLGPDTPAPLTLWPEKPPRFMEDAPPEEVTERASIRSITIPTISVYPADEARNTGLALIIAPGGGYGSMDWRTHVVYAAQVFNPMGVTVVGLKYRTRPPHVMPNEEVQALTLLDAKRAVRLVRHRAEEWGINPRAIGFAGYSAGGNLSMNLAANFDAGDPTAADPIEQQSSRPDFSVGLATWHWRQKESPFVFGENTPPVYLVHATNDGTPGGAPIEMPREIRADLEAMGSPVRMDEFDQGAHGVGNLIPQRVKHKFPPALWPQLMLEWLSEVPGNPELSAAAAKALANGEI